VDGRTQVVPSEYRVLPSAEGGERTFQVGVQVAAYDPSQPLILDPVLSYATYLGGSADDSGRSVAIDATGAVYIAGQTASVGSGMHDVFVVKLRPDASAVIYTTVFGGRADDLVGGIAIDLAGAAYVTGDTLSPDFPTTPGAVQPEFGGGRDDGFVTKLAPDGATLVYSTYLGGSSVDDGHAIAVDATGAAYVMGSASAGFPTTPGVVQPTLHGLRDAFVAKLTPDGTALVYATYVGGSGAEFGHGIAINAAGAAYVMGFTDSTNFPTTPNTIQPTFGGEVDSFISTLAPDGTAFLFSTYLGGSGSDSGTGFSGNTIAVDATGAVYVTSGTDSPDFPTTPGALQPRLGGGADAFLAKITFQPPAGDVMAIRQAIFVDPLALLFVVATSSAAPEAELSVTVPDCLMHVPMSRVKDRSLLVRTVPECVDLDGQTATVTSSRGGLASTPLR
jgi:hypothetical protein